MNYAGIIKADIANGLGVRVSIFVSGCAIGCPGCHNKDIQRKDAGVEFDKETQDSIIGLCNHKWIKGVTLTGGHPLEPYNIDVVYEFLQEFKNKLPDKDIWLYTGLVIDYDSLTANDKIGRTLRLCDVIVDGPYIEGLRNISLAFRGSSNQRIIDVGASISREEIITMDLDTRKKEKIERQ